MDATLVTVLYLYLQAFGNLRMGYASAIAWVLFVIIMFFTLLIIRSSTVWVFYETEIGGKSMSRSLCLNLPSSRDFGPSLAPSQGST